MFFVIPGMAVGTLHPLRGQTRGSLTASLVAENDPCRGRFNSHCNICRVPDISGRRPRCEHDPNEPTTPPSDLLSGVTPKPRRSRPGPSWQVSLQSRVWHGSIISMERARRSLRWYPTPPSASRAAFSLPKCSRPNRWPRIANVASAPSFEEPSGPPFDTDVVADTLRAAGNRSRAHRALPRAGFPATISNRRASPSVCNSTVAPTIVRLGRSVPMPGLIIRAAHGSWFAIKSSGTETVALIANTKQIRAFFWC
jgi:hypothetical protein